MRKIELTNTVGKGFYVIKPESRNGMLFMPIGIIAELLKKDSIELSNEIMHHPVFSKYTYIWSQTYEEGYNDYVCLSVDKITALVMKEMTKENESALIEFDTKINKFWTSYRNRVKNKSEMIINTLKGIVEQQDEIIKNLVYRKDDAQRLKEHENDEYLYRNW